MISPYTAKAKPQLVEIFKTLIPKHFDPSELDTFLSYLNQNHKTYSVIKDDDDKIVGGVGYHFNAKDKSAQITWIFLDQEASGKGLGKEAVNFCMDIFKEHPIAIKSIVTTSQRAYKFFEKFGFRTIEKEKNHWGKGLHLYLMETEF
ncbi:MAG: ribosomal protein S18 acetylase RimI-like enzyme [Limisphaerales bacterium]|jgi:ribosomal protein S18 acetylase RimI-like enzyme